MIKLLFEQFKKQLREKFPNLPDPPFEGWAWSEFIYSFPRRKEYVEGKVSEEELEEWIREQYGFKIQKR